MAAHTDWQLFFQELMLNARDQPLSETEILTIARSVSERLSYSDAAGDISAYVMGVYADGPVIYYRMDEGDTAAIDISGNAYHGVYTNTPTRVSGALTDGNSAIAFGGTDALTVTRAFALTRGMTVEFWIKP